MSASLTDKFKKVGVSDVTTLSSPGKGLAASSINVGSGSNFPTDTGFVLAIRQVDADGNEVAGTYTEWIGTISGTTITLNTTPVYGSDQVYAAGSTTQVYIPVSSRNHNDIIDGILAEHNQDGTHGDTTHDSVTTDTISEKTSAAGVTIDGLLIKDGQVQAWDGWWEAGHTLTYASGATTNVGTVTIAGVDLTGVLQAGDRVKFTQTTVKYGIITKVAFSTDTTLTIYFGTDYTIANASITNPFFSKMKSPEGFPTSPTKWTITASTGNASQASPTGSTWYNKGGSIDLPIGSWLVDYFTIAYSDKAGSLIDVFATLSTANNSESDGDFTCQARLDAAGATTLQQAHSFHSYIKNLVITSPTTYYLNAKTSISSMNNLQLAYSGNSIIKAVSAYL